MRNHLIQPLSNVARLTNAPGTDLRWRPERKVIIPTFSLFVPLPRSGPPPSAGHCPAGKYRTSSVQEKILDAARRHKIPGPCDPATVFFGIPNSPPGEGRSARDSREKWLPDHAAPSPNTLRDRQRPRNPTKPTPKANVSKCVCGDTLWTCSGTERTGCCRRDQKADGRLLIVEGAVGGSFRGPPSVCGSGDVPGGDPTLRDGLADGLAPGVDPQLFVDV